MKAIVEAKALQAALKTVSKSAGTRSSMPILNSVRFFSRGNGLEIEATDLESWARVTVGGIFEHDDNPSEAVVPSAALFEFAKSLSSGEIVIETKPDEVVMIGGASFSGMDILDYPTIEPLGERTWLGTFTGKQLKEIIGRTSAFAHNVSTTRLKLTGINISCKEGKISFATTDGYRMLHETHYTGTEFGGSILVNAAMLKRNASVVSPKTEVGLYVTVDDFPQLTMEFDSAVISFRSITEEFPNYSRVIPAANQDHTEIRVNSANLLNALQSVKPFTPDSGMVQFDIEEDRLKVSAHTCDLSHEAFVGIETKDPYHCDRIAYDIALLIDLCKQFKTGELTFALTTRLQAARITANDYPQCLAVLMPMQEEGWNIEAECNRRNYGKMQRRRDALRRD